MNKLDLNDNIEKINGHPRQLTEIYSRCVGYFRSINHWNDGKKQEFYDRKVFKNAEQKI